MRMVNLWFLRKLFDFTGTLSSYGLHGTCDALCVWIEQHRLNRGIDMVDIAPLC